MLNALISIAMKIDLHEYLLGQAYSVFLTYNEVDHLRAQTAAQSSVRAV